MKRRILLAAAAALLVAGCYAGDRVDEAGGFLGGLRYLHDDTHNVSCWTIDDTSISCLPDAWLAEGEVQIDEPLYVEASDAP